MVGTSAAARPVARGHYGPMGRSAWMDVDWRAHQRWVRIGDVDVNVVELGDGPPVVFVHGLSGSWQNWLETLPHVARSHRAIAFDLPGFGASPLGGGPISIPGYAQLVDGLCEALGLGPAAVVGNSMGGFIAAELAISIPSRVERLVLVSAAGLSTESLRRQPLLTLARALALASPFTTRRIETIARRPELRRWALRYVFDRADLLPAPLAYEQLKGSGKPGFMPALEALMTHPLRASVSRIRCPTLVVWGTHDRLVPRRDADEFERLIPGARKVLLEQTGHVPMLERPAAFNALLDAFLAGRDGAGTAVSG